MSQFTTPWRVGVALVMAVLGVVGWALHWHVTQINQTIRSATFRTAPAIVVKRERSAEGITLKQCESLKPGEPEAAIKARFGEFGPYASDNTSGPDYSIGVSYHYDYGWYELRGVSGGRFCTLYFDKDRNLGDVAIDLWSTL